MNAPNASPARRLFPRWLLFALAMTSLVLLTYGGIVLAFSVEVTPEMAAANPDAPAGTRAVVVPIARMENVHADALLMQGKGDGTFPSSATDTRMGRIILHVDSDSPSTATVDGVTYDIASLAGGNEGWILKGDAETDAWFAPGDETLGEVARYESPLALGLMVFLGSIGFVAPLLFVVFTHKGSPSKTKGAPAIICTECRAPLVANSDFCMRCGAYLAKTGDAHG